MHRPVFVPRVRRQNPAIYWEFLWILMNFNGDSMGFYGFKWGFYGILWILVDFNGGSMGFYGF